VPRKREYTAFSIVLLYPYLRVIFALVRCIVQAGRNGVLSKASLHIFGARSLVAHEDSNSVTRTLSLVLGDFDKDVTQRVRSHILEAALVRHFVEVSAQEG
jgi:hypothetical protein